MEKRGSWGSCPEVPRSYFPTTYREEGLVGKLPPNFPTTYREEGLVGKLPDVRWLHPSLTTSELPHHLYVFKAEGGKCHCSLALPRRAAKLRLGRLDVKKHS